MRRSLASALVALWIGCSAPSEPTPKMPVAPAQTLDAAVADLDAQDETAAQVAAIEQAIGERGPGVYACRSRATADDLKLDGEVQLSLTLDQHAAVSDIAVDKDTVGDALLVDCLRKLWQGYPFDGSFAAGDVVSLPPYRFVSEGAQYMVSVDHVEPKPASAGVTAARVLNQKNSGNAAFDLDVLTIDDGASWERAPKANGTELYYLVVGGGALSGRGARAQLGVGDAFYAPVSVGYRFREARDGNPTVLLRATIHNGAPGRRLFVQTADKTEPWPIAGGKAQVSLYFDRSRVRDQSAYLGLFQATPGTVVPEHVHDGSTEILFVLAGEAKMSVEGRSFPIQRGDAIQVPPNTKHAAEVMGDKPLEALQLYTPSGPEQRFRPQMGRN